MTNPFGVKEYSVYVCNKGTRLGKLIELTHRVVNPQHPRFGDWAYRNCTPGQRRSTGFISVAELERNWKWVFDQ